MSWNLTSSLLAFFIIAAMSTSQGQDLPSVYEYFTEGGIQSGLTADTPGFFKLNGKDLRIISGAVHYFRIHPSYWRDRLRKLRSTGANTVETYVPWNLHEPEKGVFDFGDGDNDFSSFLNLRQFVQIAQEEDLLVLFRPGPYICSEWDFGGLPSWLQRDPNMQVRTSYQPYLDRVKIYFDQLLPQVSDLQFARGTGPIIAIQIENEYASFNPVHKAYLEHIRDVYLENGFGDSLLFTSDGIAGFGDAGTLEGALITANFQSNPERELDALLAIQPNRPVMVMEYWAGWFDHWFEQHHTTSPDQFASVLEVILSRYNGSVNFYMFHGGTNFGFMAGANTLGSAPYYGADVTSYDYDAPLSEAGDYTEKYNRAMALIQQYQVPELRRPELLPESQKVAYPTVSLQNYLLYDDILARVPASSKFNIDSPTSMEQLPMNNDSGQSYGYIIYRKVFNNLQNGTRLKAGPVKDFGLLLIDGKLQPIPSNRKGKYWLNEDLETELSLDSNAEAFLVDILVENMARVNFGHARDFLQQKGLPNGTITVNDLPATGFQAVALEFKSKWVKEQINWRPNDRNETIPAPAMFQSTFQITSAPADTFLDMRTWHKGIVFINGFNLGRYFKAGPQQTLYIPAPLLQTGNNTITIFEQIEAGSDIRFLSQPILNQNSGEIMKAKIVLN